MSHRQTVHDEIPRGEHYLDDRTELAYVYDGESLQAILFKEREVERYESETNHTVVRTPAGEARCPA